jgi:hypothetical protein
MESAGHSTSRSLSGVVGGEDESTYRSLSVLAVIALVLGLLGPLALLAPLLLAVPFFGLAAAVIALRQISGSEGALTGRAVALGGLALSIASIATVYTRSELSEALLSRQARNVGTEWFARLQAGDVEGAFKLARDSLRATTPPPEDAAASQDAAPKPYEQFRAQPVVDFLLSHGDHAKVSYVRDVAPGAGPLANFRVVQEYTIDDQEHGSPISVALEMQRSKLDGELRWIVMSFASEQLAAPESDHAHHPSHAHPHPH